MKSIYKTLLVVLLLSPLHGAFADTMEILREKVSADKKLLIATNMDLTEAEEKAFWPIYDSYQRGLAGINQRVAKLVQDYATEYVELTLTEEKAGELIGEMLAIEQSEVDLKKAHLPKLEEALPNIKVARYLQLENKIRAVIRFDLAGGIPLAD